MSADTLSHGQRQLFNLARAILRRRARQMQRIIREEFDGYTVVMVSHRLDAVLEFDTVVVMDKGRVAETGRLRVLVNTNGSRFRELWVLAGK
ncbi:hypothetical protein AAE478_006094 [Parahypoxylon ruwenzoriense]